MNSGRDARGTIVQVPIGIPMDTIAHMNDAVALESENVPRNAGGKSPAEVREMFSRVSRRYDFLNHFLSLGLDITWRRFAAREAEGLGAGDVLADLCTGTGDLAFALNKRAPQARLIALDFTPEMVA